MECFSLSARPFYNSIKQCYIKVIQIDRLPPQNSIISTILKRVTFNNLSVFDVYSCCEKNHSCGYVVMNPNDLTTFATIDDIPLIFTWLSQNGYNINTSITEMMNTSSVKATYPLLCIITK